MKKYYFGRYIHKNSFAHGINPLVKLLAVGILIGGTAVPGSPWRLLAMSGILVLLLAISKISPGEFWPSIRSFRFLFLFTFVIQAFFTPDGDFVLKPDINAFEGSFLSTFRFVLIIAFSAFFTITSTPADIAKAIYFFVRPFKVFKADTESAAVSLLVAVRFVPLLFEETDKIITAQKLRGAWPQGRSFKEKFRFFTKAESFIIPLFMRVIYYAEQISVTLRYRENLASVMTLPRVKIADGLFFLGAAALGIMAYAL